MPLFLSFAAILAFSAMECDQTIDVELGVRHQRLNVSSGGSLCYKSAFYPFFVALPQLPVDSVVSVCTGIDLDLDNFECKNYSSFDLELAAVIEKPFGFIAINTKSGGEILSTSGSLPGKCTRGLHISSYNQDILMFRPSSSGASSIKNFDDICVIFTSQGSQVFEIKLDGVSGLDRIFYSSPLDSGVITTDGTSTHTLGNTTHCPYIRITTGRGPEPKSIVITFFSEVPPVQTPQTFYTRFNYTEAECDEDSIWYGQDLAVSLIVIDSLLFFVFGLTVFSLVSKKVNH